MSRWTASAKWAAGPALDGQRDMPLALSLTEGLGFTTGLRSELLAYWNYTLDVMKGRQGLKVVVGLHDQP